LLKEEEKAEVKKEEKELDELYKFNRECRSAVGYIVCIAAFKGRRKDGSNEVVYRFLKQDFPWANIPETKRKFDELIVNDLLTK